MVTESEFFPFIDLFNSFLLKIIFPWVDTILGHAVELTLILKTVGNLKRRIPFEIL